MLLHIGAARPQALASDKPLPDLQSPECAPELEPTLRSMVRPEVAMLTAPLAAPPSRA